MVAVSATVLAFALNDAFKKIRVDPPKEIRVEQYIASEFLVTIVTLSFLYPMYFIRTRLANDVEGITTSSDQYKFSGIRDVCSNTYRAEGMRGLYRGFVVACAWSALYRGAYYGLVASLQPLLLKKESGLLNQTDLAYGTLTDQACHCFLHVTHCSRLQSFLSFCWLVRLIITYLAGTALSAGFSVLPLVYCEQKNDDDLGRTCQIQRWFRLHVVHFAS